jgi:hypothetical protein
VTPDIPTVPPLHPDPPRDGYGRYLLPDPADQVVRPWTRATTIAHLLDDTHLLTQWKRRMVLQGCATDPTLLAGVAELADALTGADLTDARDIKAALDAICDQAAKTAGAEQGSAWGTLLHAVTEWADAGRLGEIETPPEVVVDLVAYLTVMDDARIVRPQEYIERIVVNTQVDTAGTFDRLLRLPDGRLVVGDLKTQKTVTFGWLAIAIQLAEYANADAMWNAETQTWEPLPDDLDKTVGIVMHLPVGSATCKLYELDLDAGWQAARIAHEVRQLRGRTRQLGRPYTRAGADPHLHLVQCATDTGALEGLWRNLNARGLWNDQLTTAAAARKAQLLQHAA